MRIMVNGAETNNTQNKDTIESLEVEYKRLTSHLRPLQRRFIEEYLIDLNGKQAAIRAGYRENSAEKQACRLVRNNTISQCITLATEIRSRRTQIGQDWVLISLKDQFEKADKEANRSAANRSLELIGQHLGMFGKGSDSKHLHLHKDKYVNYPPVPDTVKDWLEQMQAIGYDASVEGGEENNEKE